MTTKQRRVRIIADREPTNPREWDNVGRMVCWNRRYNLGDCQPSESPNDFLRSLAIEESERLRHLVNYWEDEGYDWLIGHGEDDPHHAIDEHIKALVEHVIRSKFVFLPLYLYDHSGITMSTGQFSCPWDSGQVGWIYCSLEHGLAECTSVEHIVACLKGEVAVYDQYLTGDVYGYIVEEADCDEDDPDGDNAEWEHVDSCWGFFGHDPFENGMAESVDSELHEMLRDAEVEYPSHW